MLLFSVFLKVYHIIRVIKSRKFRWTGCVARMGEMEKCVKKFRRET